MELWYTENHTETVKFSIKVKEHLYTKASPFQQIDVFDTYEFGKLLTIDGLVMITEKDEFIYHDMITHVPMATNPNIKKVLVIGGGDGGTVRELTRYKTIEKIDMVEIDKVVVDASREHFNITACKLDDPRVSLYFEDGIKFVEGKENMYDLIIVDSTDPIGPGEGLFTTEFYKNCYKALTEEGILVNQNESPYYEDDAREMIRASQKIKKIFPVAEVYQAHIPTYPSGHWLFGFASKKLHPLKDFNAQKWNDLGLKTKYYNTDLHKGSFALPNYVKEMIETGTI
ncbi:polyamine aminopropyltransferase [Crassaminicella profunda]|uniref:polyamine aminopropyltransferase n=1 Tax=Crassaminicella profunda TaxID=1286698 RepID=UPI001CA66C99|nr:polyamine aminopropyltransferase [Crassaminicella profunda]QZY53809.1 polyamine aminopropyltransferase [Crassaminicella profunda]